MPQSGSIHNECLTNYNFFKRYSLENSRLEHVTKVRYGLHYDYPTCERRANFYQLHKQPT